MKRVTWTAAIVLAAASATAHAQAWVPQKNIEIVAGSSPGGSNDTTARGLERLLAANKLVPTSISVINKAGGGGNIAYTYVAQHAGDPHYLAITGAGVFTNQIIGSSKLSVADFTPVAMLVNDYAVLAVNADSPLKSGKELADRLRENPRALAVGFANAYGSSRHMAAGSFIKALGGKPRELRPVVFKGSAKAISALLGGHIDFVVVGAVNSVAHVASGRMRVLAVSAPQRLAGTLNHVPTWRELGVDVVAGTWRGIFAPKNITPAQLAYWENALRKVVQTPEWKSDLTKNHWTDSFATGAEFKKELDEDYATTRAVLVDLGLAKK